MDLQTFLSLVLIQAITLWFYVSQKEKNRIQSKKWEVREERILWYAEAQAKLVTPSRQETLC